MPEAVSPMKVLLDSSIVCADYFLSSGNFEVLRDGLESAGFQLIVPEIVLEETANKYGEEVEKVRVQLRRHGERLNYLFQEQYVASIADSEVEKRIARYAKILRRMVMASGAEVLPYPEIAHADIVARELRRKKPFSNRGAGYRDFLIWESALRAIPERGAMAFISANKADFAGQDGSLHADLVEDLLQRGIDKDRVIYFESLGAFVEQFIGPSLQVVTDVQRQLEDGSYPGLDLRAWLLESSLPVLQSAEWDADLVDLPIYYLDLRPEAIQSVDEIVLRRVRRLFSGNFLIDLEARLTLELSFSRREGDEGAPPATYRGPLWVPVPGEKYIRETRTVKSGVGLRLIFEPRANAVQSADVTSWFG